LGLNKNRPQNFTADLKIKSNLKINKTLNSSWGKKKIGLKEVAQEEFLTA